MEKPNPAVNNVMQNGVIKKTLPTEEEEDNEENFNEVELTQADIELNNDRTIVVRMHSFDTSTPDLLKMAKETFQEMRKNKND